MALQVRLSNVGNPDHNQDPDRSLYGAPGARWVDVPDLAAASKLCREYIAQHELGGGNWDGGDVRDTFNNETVARVSYNGRVWDLDGREIDIIKKPAAKSPGCGI